MNWMYRGNYINGIEDIPTSAIGFVYLITNTVSGKKYIGKKLLTFAKTKQVKLKIKKFRVESDWMEYYGSNDELKEDIVTHGEDKFPREILHLCSTKGTCNYLEAREQMDRRVLERDDYYNGQVQCRVHYSHIKSLREAYVKVP